MSVNPRKDLLNKIRRRRIAADKKRYIRGNSQQHVSSHTHTRPQQAITPPQHRKHRWIKALLVGVSGAILTVIIVIVGFVLVLTHIVSTAEKTVPVNPVAPFAQGQTALPEIVGVECQQGLTAYTKLTASGNKDALVQGDGWIYADDGTIHNGTNTCSATNRSMEPAVQTIHQAGGKAYGLLTMYVPLHPDPLGYWTQTDAAKYLDTAVNSSKRPSYIGNIVAWAKEYDGIVIYLLRVDTQYHDVKGFPTSHLFTLFCQEIRKALPKTEELGIALVGKTSDNDPSFQDWIDLTSPLSKLTPSDPAINPDPIIMIPTLPTDQPIPAITVSLLEKEFDYARDNNMYPLDVSKIRWEFPLGGSQWTAGCDSAANWTYDRELTTHDLSLAMKDPNFIQTFDRRGDKEKPEFWYGGYSQITGCVVHRVFFSTSGSLRYIYHSFSVYIQKKIGASLQISMRYVDNAAPTDFWR